MVLPKLLAKIGPAILTVVGQKSLKKKQKQNKSWHIKESAQSAAHLTGD